VTHLITFSRYGAQQHDESGSVNLCRSIFGHRILESEAERVAQLKDLTGQSWRAVLNAIQQGFLYRWLLAAQLLPDAGLNEIGPDGSDRKR
jgi:hypothetical protein